MKKKITAKNRKNRVSPLVVIGLAAITGFSIGSFIKQEINRSRDFLYNIPPERNYEYHTPYTTPYEFLIPQLPDINDEGNPGITYLRLFEESLLHHDGI